MNRVGIGIDVHRFAPNRKLIIGGVHVPYEMGLEGHSDADVLAHAIADALLGAAALGDIGKFYPPSDPKWKNIDSMVIVLECAERLRKAGGHINNIDAAIVAEAPKLSPHIPKMQEILAKNLEVAPSQVGIKATTSELMGFTGRKEGIVAIAIVSVEI
ncbi:MAG TPA: 2-C-methyl-D-erythritol 2,4-cyclodiphosphate synthase [Verrucomicrobiae bacterium]|nr:2-C-methyl-D-erythritol 2,4-cyclodiphosphate synthase [Verrucomicrobiae bacterium]